MKDFLSLAEERFSVRKFKDKPVEEEKLKKILKAGIVAPTAANLQSWRCYVLKSDNALQTLQKLTPCTYGAPVVLVFTYNEDEQWKNRQDPAITSGVQDVSIAATHMMLEAWDIGIGSVMVDWFSNTAVHEAFHFSKNEKVSLLLPLGYAQDGTKPNPKHFTRRSESELIQEL